MTAAPDPPGPDRISAHIPDWTREVRGHHEWAPQKRVIRAMRAYQRARGPFAGLVRAVAVLRHRFWSALSGLDMPITSRIGGGLAMPHPNGIVIHPDAQIGVNCLIFQQVTIGATEKGIPCIGGHVDIGAGARILGPVTVGDHARIGANAVVVNDVPPGATVVGIPARIVSGP